MGQAKIKAAQLAEWKSGLSVKEKVIADVSQAVVKNILKPFNVTGGCYRISFFLTEFLKDRHEISVQPIIGYVDDGAGDVMSSHAWIEFEYKKIDLTLAQTEGLPTGDVVILDRVYAQGRGNYTYHLKRSAAADDIIRKLLNDPEFKTVIEHKEREHAQMYAIAQERERMRAYLDAAPDGLNYQALANLITKAE
jgi:hypothetical protein